MPLVDKLSEPGASADPVYPLRVAFCEECWLVQLLETPPPATLFSECYPYYSSYSSDYLAHARAFASGATARLGLDSTSHVLEIASNDGYLLQEFTARGVQVLGVDPAPGPAGVAAAAGIPTRVEFFDRALADELRESGYRASLIVANNVLAHVPDPNELLQAMALVLRPDGVVSIEVPYVRDLIEQTQFDTIYHEHHCYFSVSALKPLLERAGLNVIDVQHVHVHGGSLRVTAGFRPTGATVHTWLEAERDAGMTAFAWYARFADQVAVMGQDLLVLLHELRSQGARIVGYGAAAKGVVLLNHLDIGPDVCEFVVDRNPHKQGRRMPGVEIPIGSPEALAEARPDYVLLLAWNWAREILYQQQAYLAAGGRFIIPVPTPRLLPELG